MSCLFIKRTRRLCVGAVSTQKYVNCAKCDTSMKLGRDGQFDMLKKMECGQFKLFRLRTRGM